MITMGYDELPAFLSFLIVGIFLDWACMIRRLAWSRQALMAFFVVGEFGKAMGAGLDVFVLCFMRMVALTAYSVTMM